MSVSLAEWALSLDVAAQDASYESRIWSRVAFAGRYGHQPISEILSLPRADLHKLNTALAKLIEEEQSKHGFVEGE